MNHTYELLRKAMVSGDVTGRSNAKTWTYTPPECFCDPDSDELNPWCVFAGFHSPPYTVESFDVGEHPSITVRVEPE